MSLVETHKQSIFTNLPQDIWYIVLSYLSPNERLAILKYKYPWDKVKNKLMNMPKKEENLYRLSTCVDLVRPIIVQFFDRSGDIRKRINYWLFDNKEKVKEHGFDFCLKNFVDVIISAIRHYVRMYKETQFAFALDRYEKVMIKVYAHLLRIEGLKWD